MAADKRHPARKRAFQVLYGINFATVNSIEELQKAYVESPAIEPSENDSEPSGYAWDLVRGVWSEQKEIDGHIQGLSRNWRLERIGYVERTLLRIAFYELLYGDVPPRVILSETLDLGKDFVGAQANKFIAGMIEAAIREREHSWADER